MSDIVKKRFIINAIVAGGIAALTLVLFLDPGNREQSIPLIERIDKEQVDTIRIQRLRSEAIVLEKKNGRWRMRQPWPIAADRFRVANILNIISAQSQARYTVREQNADRFGLVPPAVTLHLNDRVVEFGDVDPLEQRRYVRIDDTVHLVDDTVAPLLMAPPASLVDRHVIPSGIKVVRIVTERFTLEHDAGEWRIRPQSETPAPDAIDERVERWRKTEASGVEWFADAPFDTDASTVTLVSQDGSELKYSVVRETNRHGLYRRAHGLFYRLDEKTLNTLTRPASGGK